MTAKTPVLSTVHHPLGKKSLWGLPGNQELPAYIQNVARAFMKHGASESDAIGKAVGVVKDWAAGRTPNGKGKVKPDVQAAAAKAIAEWERLKAKTHEHSNSPQDVLEFAGPHGYEHGWVYVGGPGLPSAAEHKAKLKNIVAHPDKFGKGTVIHAESQLKDTKAIKAALKGESAYKHVSEVKGAKHIDTANHYSVASSVVNKTLRNGEKPDARMAGLHKGLEKAFKDQEGTKENIVVHRGLPSHLLGKDNATGTVLHDKGYTSTSTDQKQAAEFGTDDNAVMHIHVPAGSKVLKPGQHSQYGDSEKEIVLNKGGSYHITGDKKVNGVRHVTAVYKEAGNGK